MPRYQEKQRNSGFQQREITKSRTTTNVGLKTETSQNKKTDTETTGKRKNETKNEINLKRKLLVYREDDNFYIDYYAACELDLISAETSMQENSDLFEISLDELFKLQNDPNIEIQYMNKEKNKSKTEEGNLRSELDDLEEGEYGIGVHGIHSGNSGQKQETALKIMEEGLKINNNSKTILSTAISLGTNNDSEQVSEEVTDYSFGHGEKTNVVIAVPLQIQNRNGEKINLGFPEKNKRTSGQQYSEHCILDQICGKMGKIPSEFILGYYLEEKDGTTSFIKNSKHFSNLSQEEQEDLYKELSSKMSEVSKYINNLIESGNIDKLSEIKEKLQERGLDTGIYDSAIELTEKNMETQTKQKIQQTIVDSVGEQQTEKQTVKSLTNNGTRKILLEHIKEQSSEQQIEKPSTNNGKRKILLEHIKEQPSEQQIKKPSTNDGKRKILLDHIKEQQTEKPSTNNGKRKILLDAYRDKNVGVGDLGNAKGALEKDIETGEKNSGGKNGEDRN